MYISFNHMLVETDRLEALHGRSRTDGRAEASQIILLVLR